MSPQFVVRRRFLLLGFILLLALVLRAWGFAWGLHDANVSRRPHPDEWAIYYLFRWFDGTRSLNPCPSRGRCFFDWGSIYPYLAYGLHVLTLSFSGLIPTEAFGRHADMAFVRTVIVGRALSVLLSSLTVVIAYRLAAICFGIGAGLLAALLVALSGLLIQLAHFATPDATLGFLMTCSLLGMTLALKRPSPSRFAVAGGLVGLAAGTEYQMALLVLPLTCVWFLLPRRAPHLLLTAYGGAAAAFFLSNPYVLIDHRAFWLSLEHAIRIRTVDSGVQYQDRWAPYGPAWLFVLRYPLGYGVGFAMAGIFLAGAAWSLWRREKYDVLLLCWLIPYLLLVSISPAKFMRYSAPLLPPLAVLAGRFLATAMARPRPRAVRGIAGSAAAVALLYSGTYDAAYAGMFAAPEPRLVATTWLAQHAPLGSQVEFEELPDGLVNLPVFVTAAGYRPCFAQFSVRRLGGSPAYVIVDNYALEDHEAVSGSVARRFQHVLAHRPDYRIVHRVAYVPTFLGLSFPISGSPHDWRYPDHEITVYSRVSTPAAPATYCYQNLQVAAASLDNPRSRG
jgi:hypothetical protein